MYNQYGRRDNIHKARIKILVHQIGIEQFTREVEEEWQAIKDGPLALDPAVVAEIAARFRYPDYERLADNPDELDRDAPEAIAPSRCGSTTRSPATRCRATRS